ncbi:MAG: hypothetical protein Q7T54_04825 [Candidatus Levybacteria bacterium]|nr:hypothetical protein [Candidatus Levybacteria bacterium]
MDQNAFLTYRDKVAISLTNRLTEALQNGQIAESDAAQIAGYLQDRLNQIVTDEEATLLLTEVAEKWKIFEQLFISQSDANTPELGVADADAKSSEQEETQRTEDIAQLNKVEEALNAIRQNTPQEQQQGGIQ